MTSLNVYMRIFTKQQVINILKWTLGMNSTQVKQGISVDSVISCLSLTDLFPCPSFSSLTHFLRPPPPILWINIDRYYCARLFFLMRYVNLLENIGKRRRKLRNVKVIFAEVFSPLVHKSINND